MPDLGIYGPEFCKAIVLFEINTIKFVKLQNFAKKQKWLNLVSEMPYLVIFGLEFSKFFVIFVISTLKFV